MKVYIVGYIEAYGGGDIAGVYSTRELAEASWEYRNDSPGYRTYEILEFDLDFDSRANEPDIDRRPYYGPRTRLQHLMHETFNSTILDNLKAPSLLVGQKPLPVSSGNTIQFFSYAIQTPPESV